MEEDVDFYANVYYEMHEGQFRSGENFWVYIGFVCIIGAGLVGAALVDFSLNGNVFERAIPGTHLPTETIYMTVLGIWSVELKMLELVLFSGFIMVLIVCSLMATKQ